MNSKLVDIYDKLYAYFGPQYWWPAETSFEVIVGAILTQNTSWLNVEKAIDNLRKQKLLDPVKIFKMSQLKLSKFIKPAGYYNIKAKRLKEFVKFLVNNYKGSLKGMSLQDTFTLRRQLLSVNGIGPETADSILLYALNKPIFVIDAYTKRVFSRHRLLDSDVSYDQAQNVFMENLKLDKKLFNEYHALLVKLAKDFCLKNKPKCDICPLNTPYPAGKIIWN